MRAHRSLHGRFIGQIAARHTLRVGAENAIGGTRIRTRQNGNRRDSAHCARRFHAQAFKQFALERNDALRGQFFVRRDDLRLRDRAAVFVMHMFHHERIQLRRRQLGRGAYGVKKGQELTSFHLQFNQVTLPLNTPSRAHSLSESVGVFPYAFVILPVDSELVNKLLELNRAFYSQVSAAASASRSGERLNIEPFRKYLANEIHLLEAGCCNGRLVEALERVGYALDYLGIDGSPELIAFAEKNAPRCSACAPNFASLT